MFHVKHAVRRRLDHNQHFLYMIFMAEYVHPLAKWREDQNPKISQDAFGEKVGVFGMTVYRWESGASMPRESVWEPIEKLTGITAPELIAAKVAAAAANAARKVEAA